VDLDQQGSLTISLGFDPEDLTATVYTVLSAHADSRRKEPPALTSVVVPTGVPGLELAPASIELAALDLELVNAYGREHVLRTALAPARTCYDYVLLDCPPSLGLVVINALAAADAVLIPLQADYLATRGVRLLLDTVEAVRTRLNPALCVEGIVLTLADARTAHTREVVERTRATFAGSIRVFEAVIKTSVRLKEAPITGQSILTYEPRGAAAAAYRALATEMEDGR
jgi:chromosome partitioning protein